MSVELLPKALLSVLLLFFIRLAASIIAVNGIAFSHIGVGVAVSRILILQLFSINDKINNIQLT